MVGYEPSLTVAIPLPHFSIERLACCNGPDGSKCGGATGRGECCLEVRVCNGGSRYASQRGNERDIEMHGEDWNDEEKVRERERTKI